MTGRMRVWWLEMTGLPHASWLQCERNQKRDARSVRRPQRRDTRPRAAIIAFRAPQECVGDEEDASEGALVILGDMIHVDGAIPWEYDEDEGPIEPVPAHKRSHRAQIIEYAKSGRSEPVT